MTVLRATNGNIQLSAGTLGSLPSGAWWVAAIVRRRGTTTDGIEAVTAIVDGGSVISSLYVDADTAPWGIYVGHGGFESTFAGLGTYGDDQFILIFAQKPAGDATPRANVFDGEDWVGWQTGSQEFEDRGDTIDAAWMINMPGGFPWNGDIAVVAWGAGNLAEADVTDGSIGLHIGVQQWLDAGPAVLWRAANPVIDESGNTPAADEVSRSGITMVDEAPAWFDMEFGGGGTTVEGAGTASSGFSATSSGTRETAGSATAGSGFTSTAAGVRDTAGSAAASSGFSATGSGVRSTTGAAAGQSGFTATASGTRAVPAAAAGSSGFTAAAAGQRTTHGSAAASSEFTATSAGEGVGQVITATASIGFTATSAGDRAVAGAAVALSGFTAGGSGVRSVAGMAVAAFGFAAAALGEDAAPPASGPVVVTTAAYPTAAVAAHAGPRVDIQTSTRTTRLEVSAR
jgi:hypothetical protein